MRHDTVTSEDSNFLDGNLIYWDGAHWTSTISPDGMWRWDGNSWQAISDSDPIRDIRLDERIQFTGVTPRAGKFPSSPTYKNSSVAIGTTWVASPGLIRWRPILFDDVQMVGVVGPTVSQQMLFQSVPWGSGAELRFRTQRGVSMGVRASGIPPEARTLLLNALPQSVDISPAAGAFLIGFLKRSWFGIPGLEIRPGKGSM